MQIRLQRRHVERRRRFATISGGSRRGWSYDAGNGACVRRNFGRAFLFMEAPSTPLRGSHFRIGSHHQPSDCHTLTRAMRGVTARRGGVGCRATRGPSLVFPAAAARAIPTAGATACPAQTAGTKACCTPTAGARPSSILIAAATACGTKAAVATACWRLHPKACLSFVQQSRAVTECSLPGAFQEMAGVATADWVAQPTGSLSPLFNTQQLTRLHSRSAPLIGRSCAA
eukprot:364407-Chlamydomonas_euryale.AAC.2